MTPTEPDDPLTTAVRHAEERHPGSGRTLAQLCGAASEPRFSLPVERNFILIGGGLVVGAILANWAFPLSTVPLWLCGVGISLCIGYMLANQFCTRLNTAQSAIDKNEED